MNELSARTRSLVLVTCAVGAGLIGAAVFGEPPQRPISKPPIGNNHKQKVAPKKHDFKESEIEIVNARQAIPFKKFDLDELSKMAGKKIMADTEITIDKKKMKAAEYLVSLNKLEEKLSAHGYSVRTGLPKGGLQARLKGVKEDPDLHKKQQKKVADMHHKVTPEKDRLAKANLAKMSKQQLPALLKTAQADHDKFQKLRQEQIAKLQKVDVNKLTADEKKVHAHFLQLIKKYGAPVAAAKQPMKFNLVHSQMQADLKQAQSLAQSCKYVNQDFKVLIWWHWQSWTADWAKTWNWSIGDPNVVDAYVQGDLEAHAYDSNLGGSALHTKGSLVIAGDVLKGILGVSFTLLDLLADFSDSDSGGHATMHAKFWGNDIFPPIDESVSSKFEFVDQDYPDDWVIAQGSFPILGILSIDYKVHLKFDVHVEIGGLLSPTWVSMGPQITVSSTLSGEGYASLEEIRAGLQGSMNLVDESLALFGKAAITNDSGTPSLDVEASVYDQLGLLGGEVDFAVQYWAFGWKDLCTIKLFGWDNWNPVNGYVYGPDTVTIPLK